MVLARGEGWGAQRVVVQQIQRFSVARGEEFWRWMAVLVVVSPNVNVLKAIRAYIGKW